MIESYSHHDLLAKAQHLRRVHGAYAIINTITGRAYVGATVDLLTRISGHRSMLSRGAHVQSLQSDWYQYGAESFQFAVLEIVSHPSKLGAAELHWQKTFLENAGLYNRFDGRDFQHHSLWDGSDKRYGAKKHALSWIKPERAESGQVTE